MRYFNTSKCTENFWCADLALEADDTTRLRGFAYKKLSPLLYLIKSWNTGVFRVTRVIRVMQVIRVTRVTEKLRVTRVTGKLFSDP